MRVIERRKGRSSRRGVALVTALVTAFVAAAMVMVMIIVSRASNDVVQVVQHSTEARFLGEGSLEIAKQELRFAMANSLDERIPDWYAESGEADPELGEWWTRFQEVDEEERNRMAKAHGGGGGRRRRRRKPRKRSSKES